MSTPADGPEWSPTDSPEGYPVDANGFVRQCAWCRRIANADGQYRLMATALVHGASHGCCEACAIRFLGPGATRATLQGRIDSLKPDEAPLRDGLAA